MASVLHGSAGTKPRVRAELQASKDSGRVLAAAYGLNPTAAWARYVDGAIGSTLQIGSPP